MVTEQEIQEKKKTCLSIYLLFYFVLIYFDKKSNVVCIRVADPAGIDPDPTCHEIWSDPDPNQTFKKKAGSISDL